MYEAFCINCFTCSLICNQQSIKIGISVVGKIMARCIHGAFDCHYEDKFDKVQSFRNNSNNSKLHQPGNEGRSQWPCSEGTKHFCLLVDWGRGFQSLSRHGCLCEVLKCLYWTFYVASSRRADPQSKGSYQLSLKGKASLVTSCGGP
jgi:hypothetical protein